MVQIVRGFGNTQGSGNASLTIHSGGRAVVVNWKKAIAAAKGSVDPKFTELMKSVLDKDMKATIVVNKAEKFDDFLIELKRQVPFGKPHSSHVCSADRQINR